MDSFIKKPYQFYEIYQSLNEQLGLKFEFDAVDDFADEKLLTIKMFEKIDEKLLRKLEIAIKNLTDNQINEVIYEIDLLDLDLAKTFRFYTKNLKYTEIFRILNGYLLGKKI